MNVPTATDVLASREDFSAAAQAIDPLGQAQAEKDADRAALEPRVPRRDGPSTGPTFWEVEALLRRASREPDGIKPRPGLIPADALLAVSRVLAKGRAKHGDAAWRHRENPEDYDAAMRHLLAWWDGDGPDDESGESHLAHAVTRLLFMLSRELGLAERLVEAEGEST